VTHYRSSVL